MRGDIVHRVYGVHTGRAEDVYFSTHRTLPEAEAAIEKLKSQASSAGWPDRYHDRGFVVREARVETDFEIPSLPKPRDRYRVKATPKPMGPGRWDYTTVEVFRRDGTPLAAYERNYSMLQTFEPFRQAGHDFALISRSYTVTAVLDLATGQVIAEEIDKSGAGFCPVGFYVPDWWDVNGGSIIPGSAYWDSDKEWPNGDFGFVWGCHWGDDSSWKVQCLDLSRIREGILRRDDRFGYLELGTSGYTSPVFLPRTSDKPSPPPGFIEVWIHEGVPQIRFAVALTFNLQTGQLNQDQLRNLTREQSGPG